MESRTGRCDAVEILDALKNNTVVKEVSILGTGPNNQEANVKLFELMKCNKSVDSLTIGLERGLQGERTQVRKRLFATMATSGGWSSIKELVLCDTIYYHEPLVSLSRGEAEPLSVTDAENISSFIAQSENLRTLRLQIAGNEVPQIVETLSRTKVQSLQIPFRSPCTLQNEGRQLTTALERCTCITELELEFPDQGELFQHLLLESIPKMLGLKKLELEMDYPADQQFFDIAGQCIGLHQGEIEELILMCHDSTMNSSIVGLAPALRRLKVIYFQNFKKLSSQQIGELSGIAADCDTLEEFWCDLDDIKSTDDFKNICHFLSTFPSLKRVTKERVGREVLELREESRFVAFLEMVKTSKTIEQIPPFRCRTNEKEAAIKHHCRSNMVHNQIREKDFLAATVPSSACPLILKEFSDLPDVLYYLLQQKNGAMVGPTCHG